MPLDQLSPYLPMTAIAAGVLLLLWGQRDRLKPLIDGLRSAPKDDPEMSPADRFATFHALRTWCEEAGQAEAVKALDGQVLPAIVHGGGTKKAGGPTS